MIFWQSAHLTVRVWVGNFRKLTDTGFLSVYVSPQYSGGLILRFPNKERPQQEESGIKLVHLTFPKASKPDYTKEKIL